MTENLNSKFIELCKNFADKHNALFADEILYKKDIIYSIELSLLKIEFCYIEKASSMIPASTLYCRIYINKNSNVHFLIPDLLVALNKQDFRGCCFSLIENEQRMENCFNCLAAIIEDHLSEFEKLALDNSEILKELYSSYKKIFSLKEKDLDFSLIDTDTAVTNHFIYLQKYRDKIFISKFNITSPTFKPLILGKREKTLKIYEKWSKKGYLVPYEEKLFEYLKSADGSSFSPFENECIPPALSLSDIDNNPLDFLKSLLVVYIPFALFFATIFGVTEIILSHNSVAVFCTHWYWGFIPAVICSFFGAIAFRNPIRRLLYKEGAKSIIELDAVLNTKKMNRTFLVVFIISAIISLFLTIMINCGYVVFKENSFKYYNDENLIPTYTECNYDDIENIYYIQSRYNEYGDRIQRASYVLDLNNGKLLDLDGYTTPKETEKKLLPFLERKGFTVEKLDSDKDLPKQ